MNPEPMTNDLPRLSPVDKWQRFVLDRTDRSGDCWIWTKALEKGYARTKIWQTDRKRCRNVRVHRISYEAFVGPIPQGMVLDHLCRNPACLNPLHLEPVTWAENIRRGTEVNANKTHCKNGHEFTTENTRWRSNQFGRDCRACQRERWHRNKARKAVA